MRRRSPSGWTPRFKLHHVARNAMGDFPSDELLRQVRERVEVGERVRVCRPGFRNYDIVRNGSAYLALPVIDDDPPIGTYSNVCAAVLAGDAYAEAVRRGEYDADHGFGGNDPKGAA